MGKSKALRCTFFGIINQLVFLKIKYSWILAFNLNTGLKN